MADEKLNTSPGENPQPSLFDDGSAGVPAPDIPAPESPAPENTPEQAAGDAPAQDAPAGAPGEVNVSADVSFQKYREMGPGRDLFMK